MFQPSAPDWRLVPVSKEEAHVVHNINQLLEDIEQTTAALKRMKAGLEGLNARLFELRAPRAPIQRVPNDVLCEIFQAASESIFPDGWIISTQKKCGLVCRRWNQLVQTCTPLWTSFRVSRPDQLEDLKRRFERLPDSIPLSLSIEYPFHDSKDIHTASRDFVAQNMSRLRTLVMECQCSSCLEAIFGQPQKPPGEPITTLTHLDLDVRGGWHLGVDEGLLDLRRLVSLRVLSYSANGMRNIPRRFSELILFPEDNRLASLKLHTMKITWSQFRAILQACPRLQQLDLDHTWLAKEEDDRPPLAQLTLSSLERMRICSRRPDLSTSLTEGIHLLELPSLRCLDVWVSHECNSPSALVHMLRPLGNARHVRFCLEESLFKGVLRYIWEDDTLLPNAYDLHLDGFSNFWEFPDSDYWKNRASRIGHLLNDMTEVITPIIERRWRRMTNCSPSACLAVSPFAPSTLVEFLRKEGVRVEIVELDPEAWPGDW